MEYRSFGATGLQVSRLVYGGGAVGGLLINADEDTRHQAIQLALDAGINWIDTAPLYGNGESEKSLGRILPGLESTPYVSSKFMLDVSNPADIKGQIERSLEASYQRLKCDSVTLMQLHNPLGTTRDTARRVIDVESVTRSGGVLDVLHKLRDDGWFQHLGITALGETESILQVIKSGRIESAQIYYNLLNPSAAAALPDHYPAYSFAGVLQACEEHSVGTMNVRVFSAGVIATDHRHGREAPLTIGDTLRDETEKTRQLFELLGDQHGSRAQTAIRFAMSEQRLDCIVLGLAEIWQLQEALAGYELGELSAAEIQRIYSSYAQYSPGAA